MILDTIIRPKRYFDVNSKKDIAMFSYYVKNKAWGRDGCPFTLEFPYLTVPDMIKEKLILKFLKV